MPGEITGSNGHASSVVEINRKRHEEVESLGDILKRVSARRGPVAIVEAPETTLALCSRCGGCGWLLLPWDKRGRDWIRNVAPCPDCTPAKFGQTFANFNCSAEWPTLLTAWKATSLWAAGEGPAMLIFNGTRGVGKSHLAKAAHHYRRLNGGDCLWLPDGDIVDGIHESFTNHSTVAWIEQFGWIPFFILDDFGLSATTPAVDSLIDRMIDKRVEAIALIGGRTLITTNLRPNQLSDRTNSRLRDVRHVQSITIAAPDYRQHPHGGTE